MIVNGVEKTENFLKTPYKGGYPDTLPATLIFSFYKNGFHRSSTGVLVSLKVTCKQLRQFIAKTYTKERFEVSLEKDFGLINVLGNDTILLPDSEETLLQKGVTNESSIKINIMEESPFLMHRNLEDTAPKKSKYNFPILQEEIFEDVEDEDFSSEFVENPPENKKEENSSKQVEQELLKLEEEFEEKYKKSEEIEGYNFPVPPVSDMVKDLKALLNFPKKQWHYFSQYHTFVTV
eukprot:TRINITY_DN2576_c0_g1_i1.p4 TRINITY_DN2576_c0_g1~~TRINITY_DN2576_c0_g1_i1.p4  ORF type:complete len:235 (+),score=33.82 TRINITY_DN2576_c0_g1_i1:4238-4942(+)